MREGPRADDGLEWRLLGERPGPSRYAHVVTRTYRTCTGEVLDWDVLETREAVAVLAFASDGRIVLVRQFRPGPGRVLLEMPGGDVDGGETPLQAATRELLEETGHRAGHIELVGGCWTSANSTLYRHVAVATGCVRVREQDRSDRGLLNVVLMEAERFRSHVRTGEMTDVDLAYLALDHLSGR